MPLMESSQLEAYSRFPYDQSRGWT